MGQDDTTLKPLPIYTYTQPAAECEWNGTNQAINSTHKLYVNDVLNMTLVNKYSFLLHFNESNRTAEDEAPISGCDEQYESGYFGEGLSLTPTDSGNGCFGHNFELNYSSNWNFNNEKSTISYYIRLNTTTGIPVSNIFQISNATYDYVFRAEAWGNLGGTGKIRYEFDDEAEKTIADIILYFRTAITFITALKLFLILKNKATN